MIIDSDRKQYRKEKKVFKKQLKTLEAFRGECLKWTTPFVTTIIEIRLHEIQPGLDIEFNVYGSVNGKPGIIITQTILWEVVDGLTDETMPIVAKDLMRQGISDIVHKWFIEKEEELSTE